MDRLILAISEKFLQVRVSHGIILKGQSIIGCHQYHQYKTIINVFIVSHSDLKFFNHFPITYNIDRGHLLPSSYSRLHPIHPSFPLCLCSSNANLLAVVPNVLFSLPRTLSFLFGKLLPVRTLFSSFLQNSHLINVPWLFKALPGYNWVIF